MEGATEGGREGRTDRRMNEQMQRNGTSNLHVLHPTILTNISRNKNNLLSFLCIPSSHWVHLFSARTCCTKTDTLQLLQHLSWLFEILSSTVAANIYIYYLPFKTNLVKKHR